MVIAVITLLAVLVYTWVCFPAMLVLLARHRRRTPRQPGVPDDLPPVAVVFSAHNEEKVIGARLSNLLALDYPRDRLAILAGVDGSSDRTEAIVRQWMAIDSRIQVVVQNPCRGKTSMLKRLVAESAAASGPMPPSVLVFTDANTMFERDALRRLVAPLSDPRIGGVCGRLILEPPGRATDPSGAPGTDESVYWDLEAQLKEAESGLDSCLGANGAIYAIRRPLFFADIPDNTIIDDFVIGMKVREQGVRMVFEPLAVAREDLPETVGDEWCRRVRIGAGAYQALSLCRACLRPRFGRFALCFWSHKILRWFTPHLLMVLLALLAVLLVQWLIAVPGWAINLAAVAVALAYLIGLVLVHSSAPAAKVYDLASYFMIIQAALFVGFIKFCRGNLSGSWERTERV